MHKERLTQLARVVRKAPKERFHMRAFRERATCGTAYCAAGWAAIDPWFTTHDFPQIIEQSTSEPEVWWAASNVDKLLGTYFGLDVWDTDELFALRASRYGGKHDITKREVLANIRRILNGKPAIRYRAVEEEDAR